MKPTIKANSCLNSYRAISLVKNEKNRDEIISINKCPCSFIEIASGYTLKNENNI